MAKLRTGLESSMRLAMPLKLVSPRGLVQVQKRKGSLDMLARKESIAIRRVIDIEYNRTCYFSIVSKKGILDKDCDK